MNKHRAQCIVVQDNNILFGKGFISLGYCGHFFIGGRIEERETPEEAAVRELQEEANVSGNIIFKLERDIMDNHHTFLVDIGSQIPVLGFDPEIEEQKKEFSKRSLQDLELVSLEAVEKFTEIDIMYFDLLIDECNERSYQPSWLILMEELVEKYKTAI